VRTRALELQIGNNSAEVVVLVSGQTSAKVMLGFDVVVNRSSADTRWQQYSAHSVDTRWQQHSAHSHTNSTQNVTMKQNAQNKQRHTKHTK
jgi:hypothetical protein